MALPPAALRSAAYPAARALGRGRGYDYPHDHPGHVNDQEHLPAGVENQRFYDPGDGEPALRERTRRDPPVCAGGTREASAEATRGAQPLWSLVPVSARAGYIRRAAVAMLDELDDLALLLADETGRPRTDIVLTELCPPRGGCANSPTTGRARSPTSACGR